MAIDASPKRWKEEEKIIIDINNSKIEFVIIKKLSSGGFGEVWLVSYHDTLLVVKNSFHEHIEELRRYGR
jgi:hypothetical protein